MFQIGKVGKICGGEEDGRFAKVDELPGDPPSYLILLAHDPEFTHGCGDYWVESGEDLEEFIRESRWSITWPPDENGDGQLVAAT